MAPFRCLNDFISDGIRSAYYNAKMELNFCLAHSFGWNLNFNVLLERARVFLVGPIGERANHVINFLINQHLFFSKYNTFYYGHPFTAPPSLLMLEEVIGCLATIASFLGMEDCR